MWRRCVPALAWLVFAAGSAGHAQSPGVAAARQAPPVPAGSALWWPGFIDARGKTFLELPNNASLCALARDAVRKTAAQAGRVMVLPVKVETLLPPGTRLVFGVIDTAGVASERVMTRVVTIARGADKGACAHIAEAGAEAPGTLAEEDRTAFGVHPPRPLVFRAPLDAWRSFGAAGTSGNADSRFAAADDVPPVWRARVIPFIAAPKEVFGQRFAAVLERGREATRLTLTGAIGASPEFDTVNLIVRDTPDDSTIIGSVRGADGTLYQSGPSGGTKKNRLGSFVAQVLGTLDLDGDGVDEMVLRTRYYSGGNLKVLRRAGAKYVVIRDTAYEGE